MVDQQREIAKSGGPSISDVLGITVGAAFLKIDSQGRIRGSNSIADELLGLNLEDQEGTIHDILPDELSTLIEPLLGTTHDSLDFQASIAGEWRRGQLVPTPDGVIVRISDTSRDPASIENRGGSNGHQAIGNLHQITEAASSAESQVELYRVVYESVKRLMETDAFTITLVLPGDDFPTTVYRVEGDVEYPPRRPAARANQDNLRLLSTVIVDTDSPNGFGPELRFGDPENVVKSIIFSPLLTGDEVIGALTVQSYRKDAYRIADAELMSTIAQSVASAIQRANILHDLEHQVAREELLRSIAEEVHASLDPDELLEHVADKIFEHVGGSITVITTIDPESAQVLQRTIRSTQDEIDLPPQGTSLITGGISHDAAVRREQIYIGDLNADDHSTNEIWTRIGVGAMLATPILDDDRCLGILTTSRHEPESFDRYDFELFQSIAALLAEALSNAYLFKERLRHVRDLSEVQRISTLAGSSLNSQDVVNQIVSSVTELFGVDGCGIRRLSGNQLIRLAASGSSKTETPESYPMEGTLNGTVIETGLPVVLNDIRDRLDDYVPPFPEALKMRAFLSVPLNDVDGTPFGTLAVHFHEPHRWSERELRLIETIATNTSVAIRNATDFERTRDILRASIESLAAAVDAKDSNTLDHSRNVARYSLEMAKALDMTDEQVRQVELAALLHDVGKIGVPDPILVKPAPLDPAEWAAMQLHPIIGSEILGGNGLLRPLATLVRHHHERYDGFGYPDRLAGDDIPLGSAIVGVAEAFDTMIVGRPYRSRSSVEDAIAEIQQGRGNQFHPEAVDALLEGLKSGVIRPIVTHTTAAGQPREPLTERGRAIALDARATMIFHGVAQEIGAISNLQSLIDNIARLIRDAIGDYKIEVDVIEPGTLNLRAQASIGKPTSLGLQTGPMPLDPNGIVSWVARHGKLLNIPDVRKDRRYRTAVENAEMLSELAIPLIVQDQVIGVINVESEQLGAFTAEDEQLLVTTADYLAQAIHTAMLIDQVREQASTDALTGLANHRTFYESLDRALLEAATNNTAASLVIFDVNRLKAVNDTYGHLAGDEALKAIARALRLNARESDIVCRYGGDEFAIVMPDTDRQTARSVVERYNNAVAMQTFHHDGHQHPVPSGAWGIAEFPADGLRPSDLVRIADENMYATKRD